MSTPTTAAAAAPPTLIDRMSGSVSSHPKLVLAILAILVIFVIFQLVSNKGLPWKKTAAPAKGPPPGPHAHGHGLLRAPAHHGHPAPARRDQRDPRADEPYQPPVRAAAALPPSGRAGPRDDYDLGRVDFTNEPAARPRAPVAPSSRRLPPPEDNADEQLDSYIDQFASRIAAAQEA